MKKGQLTLAATISAALSLVLLSLLLTVGQDVESEMRTDATNQGYVYNASVDSAEGLDKISNWQKTIGLVIGAGAVLTVVIAAFAMMRLR